MAWPGKVMKSWPGIKPTQVWNAKASLFVAVSRPIHKINPTCTCNIYNYPAKYHLIVSRRDRMAELAIRDQSFITSQGWVVVF